MIKVIIYKVYLSIGTLENSSHSYYTRKSKNVKSYTIIIPKKVNFATLGVILVVVGCKTLSCI